MLSIPFGEHDSAEELERIRLREPVYSAFLTLPARWREAIWYGGVEAESPETYSRYVGMTPDQAAALFDTSLAAYQAAFFAESASRAVSPTCQGTLDEMVAGGIDLVVADAAECVACALTISTARTICDDLGRLLVPVTIGMELSTYRSFIKGPHDHSDW